MKTLQEAFDTMLFHIRAQGYQRAVNEKGHCQYRADGKKCAVGALIPDDLYTRDLDIGYNGVGYPVQTTAVANTLASAGWRVDTEALSMYAQAQDCHDDALNWDCADYFESRMRSLAARFNLAYTAP